MYISLRYMCIRPRGPHRRTPRTTRTLFEDRHVTHIDMPKSYPFWYMTSVRSLHNVHQGRDELTHSHHSHREAHILHQQLQHFLSTEGCFAARFATVASFGGRWTPGLRTVTRTAALELLPFMRIPPGGHCHMGIGRSHGEA